MELTTINWNEVPEVITKEQLWRLCHISKSTARFLLKSGKIPCQDSGKKTRRYRILKSDVLAYLEDRERCPERLVCDERKVFAKADTRYKRRSPWILRIPSPKWARRSFKRCRKRSKWIQQNRCKPMVSKRSTKAFPNQGTKYDPESISHWLFLLHSVSHNHKEKPMAHKSFGRIWKMEIQQ